MQKKIAGTHRPVEKASGIVLAATVYGFLANVGVPNVVAAIVGVVVAFGPYVASEAVSMFRARTGVHPVTEGGPLVVEPEQRGGVYEGPPAE